MLVCMYVFFFVQEFVLKLQVPFLRVHAFINNLQINILPYAGLYYEIDPTKISFIFGPQTINNIDEAFCIKNLIRTLRNF